MVAAAQWVAPAQESLDELHHRVLQTDRPPRPRSAGSLGMRRIGPQWKRLAIRGGNSGGNLGCDASHGLALGLTFVGRESGGRLMCR